jgi:outer membrane protein OmpA-like peptidoglycan-associated protein
MKVFLQKYLLFLYGFLYVIGISNGQEIRITFPYNVYDLKDHDIALVQETIRLHPDVHWLVNGRASSSGGVAYNSTLSNKRAQEVNKILKAAGIASSDVTLTYSGKEYADHEKEDPTDRVVIIRWTPKMATEIKKIGEQKTVENIAVEQAKLPMSKIHVSVFDALDKKPVSGTFTVNGNKSEFKQGFEIESVAVPIKISSPGYKDSTVTVKLGENGLRVEMLPDYVVEKLVVENVYFFPGTPEIIPESFRALQDMYDLLKGKKDVNIEIRGHVNWPTYHQVTPDQETQHNKLSDQRALAVMNWLIKKGIPAEILSYKGFGATQMLYPQAISEGHQAYNRRVEVVILKKP